MQICGMLAQSSVIYAIRNDSAQCNAVTMTTTLHQLCKVQLWLWTFFCLEVMGNSSSPVMFCKAWKKNHGCTVCYFFSLSILDSLNFNMILKFKSIAVWASWYVMISEHVVLLWTRGDGEGGDEQEDKTAGSRQHPVVLSSCSFLPSLSSLVPSSITCSIITFLKVPPGHSII